MDIYREGRLGGVERLLKQPGEEIGYTVALYIGYLRPPGVIQSQKISATTSGAAQAVPVARYPHPNPPSSSSPSRGRLVALERGCEPLVARPLAYPPALSPEQGPLAASPARLARYSQPGRSTQGGYVARPQRPLSVPTRR